MVRHIVLWNWKPELSAEQRAEAGERIRRELEAVGRQASGVVSLQVVTDPLPSGNKDIGLISAFESAAALDAYQVHPAHVQAGAFIRTVTCDRVCLDYQEA